MINSGELIIDILINEFSRNPIIAFMPYKREMWDCMKTVYDAAIARGVKAYVIPLPYFVLYNNKIRPEDNPIVETIDDVPNTPFTDFLKLGIDVVVYHNQYDNFNKLTSIHPMFYTSELKKKAKLAYIPYSPLKGPKPYPGARNCDYAFCIDEEDKADWLRTYPDKKVFVVGSPKIEYVEKYCKEKKQIVLIAASLMPFLRDPHNKMEKYKEIVTKYETVIFRPHPLMNAGINSMVSGTKDEYEKFLKWMKHNAIIDYSEYPEKTIAMCDMMFADKGSMVELWKPTNKPYEII